MRQVVANDNRSAGNPIVVDACELLEHKPDRKRYVPDPSMRSFDVLSMLSLAVDTEDNDRRVVVRSLDFRIYRWAAGRVLRELWFLKQLQHENLSHLLDVFVCHTNLGMEINLVYEHMAIHLSDVMRPSHILNPDHTQFLVYQILRGLKYLHSGHVTHGDLKPDHILINQHCDLKICGFGHAVVHGIDESTGCLALCESRLGSRRSLYTAPELICSTTWQGLAVDIWSAACIFAEFLLNEPLFMSRSTKQQLELIVSLTGTPSEEELLSVDKPCLDCIRNFMIEGSARTFDEVFKDINPVAVDLLRLMLCWNSAKRVTAADALAHTYLDGLYYPQDEPTREPLDVDEFDLQFSKEFAGDELHERVLIEGLKFHPGKYESFCCKQRERALRAEALRLRLVSRDLALSFRDLRGFTGSRQTLRVFEHTMLSLAMLSYATLGEPTANQAISSQAAPGLDGERVSVGDV